MRNSSKLLKSIEIWIKNEGEYGAIQRLKAVHQFSVRAILGCSHDRPDIWVCCQPNGLPKVVGYKSYLCFKDRRYAVAILSLTSSYLCLMTEWKIDLASITEGYSGKDVRCFNSEVLHQIEILDLPNQKDSFGLGWFLSSKSGPNGRPGWLHWWKDLYALYYTAPHLLPHINFLGKYFKVRARFDKIFKLPRLLRIPFTKMWWFSLDCWRNHELWFHSKLHVLKQPGSKTRIIAIGDVFSQTVLQPIHNHLMKCLRTIPQDGTFDQNAQVERIKKWVRAGLGDDIYSFDLKSCTDRFPINIQMLVISALFGDKVAESWRSIMVDRSFFCENDKNSYRYAVGQPMGLLSSWAAMALTHHVVVRICASRLHIPEASFCSLEYAILGDDIVIGDKRLANEYKRFMNKDLGVKFSMSKSIITRKGFEFAKRLVKNSTEFSPVPANLVIQIQNYPNLLPALVSTLKDRWNFDCDPRLLVHLLPVRERWIGLKLLTCPLWSSELIKSVDLWKISKASLWGLCKQFSVDKENIDRKLERIQNVFDQIETSVPINAVKWINPVTAKRGTYVHRLHLGTRDRNPEVFAGSNFIMHNLTSTVEGVSLSPDDLFVDLSFAKDSPHEKEIRLQLDMSRTLKKAMKHSSVGSFNYYLLHCLYFN